MPEEHSTTTDLSPDAPAMGAAAKEFWETTGAGLPDDEEQRTPDTIAADIQALYDQFTAPAKTWFIEQLRRGARGEPTFLDDPDEHGFEAWIRQPRTAKVEFTARVVKVPDTLAVEDALGEAECRLHAAAAAATTACTDQRAGDGIAYVIHDVCDIVRDASNTLQAMRQEGGAA